MKGKSVNVRLSSKCTHADDVIVIGFEPISPFYPPTHPLSPCRQSLFIKMDLIGAADVDIDQKSLGRVGRRKRAMETSSASLSFSFSLMIRSGLDGETGRRPTFLSSKFFLPVDEGKGVSPLFALSPHGPKDINGACLSLPPRFFFS